MYFQARNKPLNPVVKPTSAPFFLPTVPTLSGELKFDIPDKDPEGELSSKILTSSAGTLTYNGYLFVNSVSDIWHFEKTQSQDKKSD